MNSLKHTFAILLLLGPLNTDSIAQFSPEVQKQIDSLNLVIKESKYDTSLCLAYIDLSELLYAFDIDTLKKLSEFAKSIAEKNLAKSYINNAEKKVFRVGLASALSNIAYVHDIKGDISIALDYYTQALKLYEALEHLEGMALSLNNIGYIYVNQGDSAKALEFYHKSLKIEEEIGSKELIASSLTNIGAIYSHQDDISLALEYYQRSYKMCKEIGYKEGMASALNNIGAIYRTESNEEKALEYFQEALIIKEKIQDKDGIAYSFTDIGNAYESMGNAGEALKYYNKALAIREETGNKLGIAIALNNIGRIKLDQGLIKEAKKLATKSFNISKELGLPAIIRNTSKLLHNVLKEEDNYKEALKMHELYISMRDSVYKQEVQNAIIKKEAQLEIENREAKIKLLDKENEIKKAQIKNQRNLFVGGTIGIFGLILFLWRLSITNARLKLAARTLEASNKTISMQKNQAERSLAKLHESIKNPEPAIITLNSSGLRLDTSKIYYLESQNRYVLITYHEEKIESIYERTSLKDFLLNLPAGFVQIHRSYCININHIKSRVSKYKLIMQDNQLLPISASFVDEFDKVIS